MLFNTRQKRRPKQNPNWFWKKRRTVNAKLRQAIIDVMPFNTDEEEADRILHAIFDSIVEGVIRDGKAAIPYLGILRRTFHKSRAYKLYGKETYYSKPKYKVRFEMYPNFNKKYLNKDTDGNSGTDQGT